MLWDPHQYLRFADHRLRPGLELMARIPDISPRSIVDLGCGTGSLTHLLADRFNDANVVGLDNSQDMLDQTESDSIEWRCEDIGAWHPESQMDLIYSNAALHWLVDHDQLFPRLLESLSPGGVLAVQMPNNWREPTHKIPAAILAQPDWTDEVRHILPRDRVQSPVHYQRWLAAADATDLWETTYYQLLPSADRHPVLEWVKGSLLRPVLALLDEDPRALDRFLRACEHEYERAYPRESDGSVVLPFRRLFIVAMKLNG